MAPLRLHLVVRIVPGAGETPSHEPVAAGSRASCSSLLAQINRRDVHGADTHAVVGTVDCGPGLAPDGEAFAVVRAIVDPLDGQVRRPVFLCRTLEEARGIAEAMAAGTEDARFHVQTRPVRLLRRETA